MQYIGKRVKSMETESHLCPASAMVGPTSASVAPHYQTIVWESLQLDLTEKTKKRGAGDVGR